MQLKCSIVTNQDLVVTSVGVYEVHLSLEGECN